MNGSVWSGGAFWGRMGEKGANAGDVRIRMEPALKIKILERQIRFFELKLGCFQTVQPKGNGELSSILTIGRGNSFLR